MTFLPTSAHNAANLAEVRRHWCRHFCGEDGRITAWTFVPQAIVEDILAGNIQECPVDKADDEPNFMLAYEWLRDRMDESGLVGRKPGISPWWCWVRMDGQYAKPTDLNADEGFVLLELSLDPEDVLLSDFHFWHVPLNYWYFGGSEEAGDAFDEEMKAIGLNIWTMKPLPEPHHSRVQDSWREVFLLDCQNDYTYAFEDKAIQGVFWRMKPENIKGIVEPDIYKED